jgi:hypothetical protein
MCFAGRQRNDRTSTIPIAFCLFGFVIGSLLSWARLRSSGRNRSFAGTVLGFGRIGAGDHATMLAPHHNPISAAFSTNIAES